MLRGAVGSASDSYSVGRSAVNLSLIKGCRCFIEQETLPSMPSTGWFQEQVCAYSYLANHRTIRVPAMV